MVPGPALESITWKAALAPPTEDGYLEDTLRALCVPSVTEVSLLLGRLRKQKLGTHDAFMSVSICTFMHLLSVSDPVPPGSSNLSPFLIYDAFF